MPIMTQQYLTAVYIIVLGREIGGGNAPQTVKLGGEANAPPPPFPPSSAAYAGHCATYTSMKIV